MPRRPNRSRRKVFLIFDHVDYDRTPVQNDTKNLVDRIVKEFGKKCEITKYKADYTPGSVFLTETERICKAADMTCIIMSEESIQSNMLRFIQDMSIIESVEKDNRLATITVGVPEKKIPSRFRTRNNKGFENFESVDVQDDFLKGVFLYGLPVEDGNKYPTEESGVNSTNSPPTPESTVNRTNNSQSLESTVNRTNNSLSLESTVNRTNNSLSLESLEDGAKKRKKKRKKRKKKDITPSPGFDTRIAGIWRKILQPAAIIVAILAISFVIWFVITTHFSGYPWFAGISRKILQPAAILAFLYVIWFVIIPHFSGFHPLETRIPPATGAMIGLILTFMVLFTFHQYLYIDLNLIRGWAMVLERFIPFKFTELISIFEGNPVNLEE